MFSDTIENVLLRNKSFKQTLPRRWSWLH